MKILVVDDENKITRLLSVALTRNNHQVKTASSGEQALGLLDKEDFDLIISDLKMPGIDGLNLLKRVKEQQPETEFIIMTAFGTIENAVEAMKYGAFEYVVKPFSVDEIKLLIAKINEKLNLKTDIRFHKEAENERQGHLVGDSPTIRKTRELIDKVAPTEATVLILGESGTGKELVARAVHQKSPRKDNMFVPVHCAAITETLFEAELFGYEKGAFTGADRSKKGRFEIADKGTLFLDEIGDIPLSIQVKLLRAVQEKTIVRVGGISPIETDVRIVAATNRNLEKMVNEGSFREDLYYRFAVFPIETPPLRDHKQDIPVLVDNYCRKHNIKNKIGKDVFIMLQDYNWPGNVRELENIIERAKILSGDEQITPEYILLPKINEKTSFEPASLNIDQVEKELLIKALEESNGNKTKAAKILGITRRMIYSKIQKYGLEV
ncbi:sigma-54-dependent Fis family transcriptional regulator [bacterium]|nr:sigma-54-dependent Fis family transcriptional regulator [bacterium]